MLSRVAQMVVAEPLYGFYNTEINLHFLHALVGRYVSREMIGSSGFRQCRFLGENDLQKL